VSSRTVERVAEAPPFLQRGRRRWFDGDLMFRWLASASAVAIFVIAAAFLAALVIPAWPSITRFGLHFLVGREWNPVTQDFAALPFVYGTILVSLIGMVIAFPIGLGAALVLAQPTRHRSVRALLSFGVELLAGIPSVVIGLWALFILAPVMREVVEPFLGRTLGFLPLFAGPPSGASFLTAGIVLAIMVLPILVALSRDVILAVPPELREASLALGATRAETIWQVILPYARVGITGAVLLALGRALGETIAVTLVIGNRPTITAHLFSQGYTLPSVLANEFTEAVGPLYQGALLELGLVLVLITLVVNVLARLLVWSFRRNEPVLA
jgi:phosphate transport system permease protein